MHLSAILESSGVQLPDVSHLIDPGTSAPTQEPVSPTASCNKSSGPDQASRSCARTGICPVVGTRQRPGRYKDAEME